MAKKVSYSMMITEAQKDIMDFVVDVVEDGVYSKAHLVMESFVTRAKGYCGLPDDLIMSDEMLLSALKSSKRLSDYNMIPIVGVENYKKMIKEGIDNGTLSDVAVEYMNELLEEFKETVKMIEEAKTNE